MCVSQKEHKYTFLPLPQKSRIILNKFSPVFHCISLNNYILIVLNIKPQKKQKQNWVRDRNK